MVLHGPIEFTILNVRIPEHEDLGICIPALGDLGVFAREIFRKSG
jgi:hypothetical protein